MTKATTIAGVVAGTVLVVLALTARHRAARQVEPAAASSPATTHSPALTPSAAPAEGAPQGFLYGRIATVGGAIHEGRLRFGGNQEAFWGDYFNGAKDDNPWVAHVRERLAKERHAVEIFGIEMPRRIFGFQIDRERQIDLGRLFMARFGDIARIEPRHGDVRVTLKSGSVFELDRFSASDFDDGVRVWDGQRVIDLDSLQIRTIELLPTVRPGGAPDRLHGTVRTQQGDFTGFVQWDREECVGPDDLDGRTNHGELSLRFDTIRSIARLTPDSALVTLRDAREIVLSDSQDVGQGHRGIYVDDRRYGRVLVSWDAFERVDFSPGGRGPSYGDYPAGRPLTGSVFTRSGQRLAGRLVYDLDESETTETLDAPSQGVDYTVPFGLVASIVPRGHEERGAQRSRVTLHHGEELRLERTGDLGDGNAGMLIFVEGHQRPEYVPWADVQQVDLDRPPATYPPLDAR